VANERRIRPGDVARDLRAGMPDSELLEKYRLTPSGLERLFADCVTARILQPADLESRRSSYASSIMLEDERGLERHIVDVILPVYELGDPGMKGIVQDINDNGLKVRHIEADVGDTKTLIIPADELILYHQVSFEATCRWARTDEVGHHLAGFEITKISDTDFQALTQLIQALVGSDSAPSGGEFEYDDDDFTETVDLTHVLTDDMTATGSFSFGGVEKTWFGKLLQALPLPAMVIDRSAEIIFVNRSCSKLTNERLRLFRKRFSSLFSKPSVAQEAESLLTQVFETRKRASSQALLEIDGHKIWARMYLSSVRIEATRSVLLLIEDLTLEKEQLLLRQRHQEEILRERNELDQRVKERTAELRILNEKLLGEINHHKRTGEALRESEARHRLLTDNSLTGIFIHQDGIMVYANQRLAEIAGYSTDEILGGLFLKLVHPNDRRMVHDRTNAMGRDRPVQPYYELRLKCRNGETKWVEVFDTVITYHGSESIMGNLADITDRRLLEDQFRHSQKMEAVGQLAGGVAHDFNNLLTAVIGYSEVLLREIPEADPAREKIGQIRGAADRAAGLTRQLLAFSRKQVLEVQVLDLNAIITDLESMLRRLIGEDIELVVNFDSDIGKIKADPRQIEQILLNLAINARDAMISGGRLNIETSSAVLDEESARSHPDMSAGNYTLLAVSDEGVGMDSATRVRIFDPFFTTKGVGKGTGLGLSTVYGIVKQHRGHIQVDSEPEKGSTFKVWFPVSDVPAVRTDSVTIEIPKLDGDETVLIVEDEDIVRNLACESLQMFGYSVISAGDPDEAVAVCRECRGPIHVLLTDVVLPKMDGRRLYDQLAAERPEMRVVFMSGYTEDAIVNHGVLNSGVHFLQKPFTLDGLARRIREALDGFGSPPDSSSENPDN
jgi:PAS domain S-box-containing protein